MSNQNKHIRPKYNLEFKQDAARLVLEKGYTHRQAADNLGISLSALGRWVKVEQGSVALSTLKRGVLNLSDQDELTRLRKENERLRMEREILKNTHPGHWFPMQINSLPLHWLNALTLDVSFLEVKSPSKNLAIGKLWIQLRRHFM